MKKSELVAQLAALFEDAAAGRLADAEVAGRVNTWKPLGGRDQADEDSHGR